MKDTLNKEGWSVYLLRCKGDRLYIGATNNLKNRLSMHEKGVGSKFVRAFSPFRFVASLEVGEKEKALALEYRLKRLSKFQKVEVFTKRIRQDGPITNIKEAAEKKPKNGGDRWQVKSKRRGSR